MADDEGVLLGGVDIFREPDGYFAPDKPKTYAEHTLLSGDKVAVRLVGQSPLWGHLLWNAGRTVSNYLEERAGNLVTGKDVLEFGAGAGLPSLVVVTDYPDADLLENLRFNISHSLPQPVLCQNIHAEVRLPPHICKRSSGALDNPLSGFDLLILADLLFNHSEHSKLICSVKQTLKRSPEALALVFFTPYRPWLLEKDLAFFDLARDAGFAVEKLLEHVMEKAMFDNDRGDKVLQRTVYGYELRWNT
ncbi:MAG: nicotinamide n-methyltransferase [Geoglossum simile]|nr:MAG: nicotinamide n-methyltransferase [Geoglossum simile]